MDIKQLRELYNKEDGIFELFELILRTELDANIVSKSNKILIESLENKDKEIKRLEKIIQDNS